MSGKGFASMDAEKQREIARKGGRKAHEVGTAHKFNADEARAAGRKGGERVSADRKHMSEIGRKGGMASAGKRQASRAGAKQPIATTPVEQDRATNEALGVTTRGGAEGDL